MGVGRLAPHRVRAKYAQALAQIPLPVRSFAQIDPAALTTMGEIEIGGRTIRFGVLVGTPRLWIAVPEHVPPVLGYLTGLDTGAPELHITELDHLEWARRSGRGAAIKRAARSVWQATQRECEG